MFIVLTLLGLVGGPSIILYGVHADQRDRPSLQWPKVTGKLMQCDEIYHPGSRHTSGTYSIAATYTYAVNSRRYVEHQIALWSPDLYGHTGNFAATHPVPLPVDVYYDPKNFANAVLIPGPDVAGNRFFVIDGGFLFVCGTVSALMLPRKYAAYKAGRNRNVGFAIS